MNTGDGTHFTHYRNTTRANVNPNTGSGQLTTTNGESAGATHYFEIGGKHDGITATFIRWLDAASSATITLETTNLPVGEAAFNAAAGSLWFPETSVTITGPTAVAAGCFMLHFGNNGCRRNRLKVVVAANTQLEIHPHGVH